MTGKSEVLHEYLEDVSGEPHIIESPVPLFGAQAQRANHTYQAVAREAVARSRYGQRVDYLHLRHGASEYGKLSGQEPQVEESVVSHHYALGESFIDFLLGARDGRKLLVRTVERLRAGETLFDDGEIAKLEAGWHARIRKELGIR